jgi:hypothetical protein
VLRAMGDTLVTLWQACSSGGLPCLDSVQPNQYTAGLQGSPPLARHRQQAVATVAAWPSCGLCLEEGAPESTGDKGRSDRREGGGQGRKNRRKGQAEERLETGKQEKGENLEERHWQ